MLLRTRAPAKINLTLHVVRRREDGFHDLASLVAFAGVSDILQLAPGEPLSLTVEGPTAPAAGRVEDNLVLKAARILADRVPGLGLGAFHLTKRLPVGAGIGGGSSDAAAGLRLLARLNGITFDDPRLEAAARDTGSDVPVCVAARSRMMHGTGDRLGRTLAARRLFALLVNPGIHLDTRAVFGGMGWQRGQASVLAAHPAIHDDLGTGDFLHAVQAARNDMQEAAAHLAPTVGDVIAALRRLDGVRLARMSGSGSTCFALFESSAAARAAGAAMRARHPQWWVRATALL